jgi:hypothetical protein
MGEPLLIFPAVEEIGMKLESELPIEVLVMDSVPKGQPCGVNRRGSDSLTDEAGAAGITTAYPTAPTPASIRTGAKTRQFVAHHRREIQRAWIVA